MDMDRWYTVRCKLSHVPRGCRKPRVVEKSFQVRTDRGPEGALAIARGRLQSHVEFTVKPQYPEV